MIYTQTSRLPASLSFAAQAEHETPCQPVRLVAPR
jgi:hypothetical protein